MPYLEIKKNGSDNTIDHYVTIITTLPLPLMIIIIIVKMIVVVSKITIIRVIINSNNNNSNKDNDSNNQTKMAKSTLEIVHSFSSSIQIHGS